MSALQSLPDLVFAERPHPKTDIGAQGELKWLPLSQLFIDQDYQRTILDTGKGNVRRMIEGFSWLLFGVVIVGRRGENRFAIIDGQHRATAAKLHGGIDKVPCLILKGGKTDEATAFAAINHNVTRIHALQSFHALIAAGDPAACELVEFCAQAMVTITAYPKVDLKPGETMALGALRQIRKRYEDRSALVALKFLRALDPSAGLGAPAVLGTAKVFHGRLEWRKDATSLALKLREDGRITRMTMKSSERRASYGGTLADNFAAVLTDALRSAERAGTIPLKKLMGGRG